MTSPGAMKAAQKLLPHVDNPIAHAELIDRETGGLVLIEALRKYGRHHMDCPKWCDKHQSCDIRPNDACTCGFEAVLKGIERQLLKERTILIEALRRIRSIIAAGEGPYKTLGEIDRVAETVLKDHQ